MALIEVVKVVVMIDLKKLKNRLLGEESGQSLTQSSKQKKKVVGMIAAVIATGILMTIGHMARENKKKKPQSKPEPTVVGGVVSSDFTAKNELSAIEKQQNDIESLKGNINNMKKEFKTEISKQGKAVIDQINSAIAVQKSKRRQSTSMGLTSGIEAGTSRSRVVPDVRPSSMSFHYQKPIDQEAIVAQAKKAKMKYAKTPDNYVPATTHVRGVLLEGADANASVNGQSDTVGVLIRLLDNGTLPNGKHSHLNGCNVLARVYGDISSERVEARLNRISCTKPDGTILDKKVQGYLSFAGKEGVKGTPIMRNGKIVFAAGVAGLLNSASAAAQQATQTQSVSALGSTTSVNAGQMLANIAAGAGSSSGKALEDYYIKLANQYHPIIEIGSGTMVTVIFQKGFSLTDKDSSEGDHHTYSKHVPDSSVRRKQAEAEKIKQIMKKGVGFASKFSGSADAPFSNISK